MRLRYLKSTNGIQIWNDEIESQLWDIKMHNYEIKKMELWDTW